jgi:hypothetical protein
MLTKFIITNYIAGGLIPMIVTEFFRGIFWTLGAIVVIKIFKIKL